VILFVELVSENFSAIFAGLLRRPGVLQDQVTLQVVLGGRGLGAEPALIVTHAVFRVDKLPQELSDAAADATTAI